MSIADNVILENTRLGTARTNLRTKLTNENVPWYTDDTIMDLARRIIFFKYDMSEYSSSYYSDDDLYVGQTIEVGVTGLPVAGIPLDVIINGNHYIYYSDSSGDVECGYVITEDDIGELTYSAYIGGKPICTNITITVHKWGFKDQYADNTNRYRIVKYPSDLEITLTTGEYDSNYDDDGMLITKTTSASSVGMLIPAYMVSPIDATEDGIHFKIKFVHKKTSNQGWGDCIALVNSDSLSNYRDTKILELGAYPAKKGVKYSNSDHTLRELSVTSGQLTLDSKWYTLEMYYDSGYLEAYIKDGSTNVFSYSGDISNSITFDEFYPAIMIYDQGGSMIFNNVVIEPWTHEVSNNG